MNKKAALELSINAIVIIVIAMAVLGLGLGFVRNQLGQMGKTTTEVQQQIREQVLQDLRTGDKKLSLQSSEVTISKGDSTVLGFGIKNTLNEELTFGIKLVKISGTIEAIFEYDDRPEIYTLSPTDADVYSARLTAPTTSGTSIYEITITGKTETLPSYEYAKKTFFVTVTG